MKTVMLMDRGVVSVSLLCGLCAATALAHGPNIVLSDVGGQIVTNQLDVTPQSDLANSGDYPLGSPARVFPSQYNATNFNTFTTSAYAANQPATMQAIPMTWVTVSGDTTGDAGYYGQMEVTDAVGNNTLNTGPGYAYGNGGFVAGTVFQITFGSKLQYFNASTGSFTTTPDGEQLQAIRGSSITPGTGFANTLTSNGVSGGTGLQVSVSASQNPGSHSQLMYRLEDSSGNSVEAGETQPSTSQIADGLYLATFDVGTATTSVDPLTSSLPYYFLFDLDRNNDVPAAEVNAAVASVDAIAGVPEPTSVGVILVGCGALLGRRPRRA